MLSEPWANYLIEVIMIAACHFGSGDVQKWLNKVKYEQYDYMTKIKTLEIIISYQSQAENLL